MVTAESPRTKSWNPDPFTEFVEDALKVLQNNTWSIFDSVMNPCTHIIWSHFNFTRMRYWRMVHETRNDVVVYPLTRAQDELRINIHRYINTARVNEIKQVLDEYGMEKWGKKLDLTWRLTNKLMIVYQIPGRETFDRMCQAIDQIFIFPSHYRNQTDYPFKSGSVLHYDMSVPFESLVEMSKSTVCVYRLQNCFKYLRDMTPAISCAFAYGRWTTFTLPNATARAGISWKIVFTAPKSKSDVGYRYDMRINDKPVLLTITKF